MKIFVPIKKVDAAQRLVYGTVAAEIADKSGEILDYATAKPAFEKWTDDFSKATEGKSAGNLRAMHGNVAAGVFKEISFDDNAKEIYGVAKVVDDNEWKKVEAGVYTGFSIGGAYEKRWEDNGLKRYTPTLSEISLVDNPCIPTATFEMIKEDGSVEMRKFVTVERVLKQVWLADDGTNFEKKADAIKHNAALDAGEIIKRATAEAESVAASALAALAKADEMLGKEAEKEPYGDVEYADDGFQEDKKKRYPIDTEDHIRAAWNYINKEKNAAQYSAEEVGKIKGKIVAAWKKKIDKDGPPSAEKAVKSHLRKGLGEVARAAMLIEELHWLEECIEMESFYEGDASELPIQLEAILAQLCEFLKALVEEEVDEMLEEEAEEEHMEMSVYDALGKYSEKAKMKADKKKKKGEVDEKAKQENEKEKASAKEDMEAEKLAPAALQKINAENDALKKVIGDMTGHVEKLVKRIENLERQPMPPKGALRVVHKGYEGNEEISSLDAVKAQLAKMSPEERAHEMMKLALSNPNVR